MLLWLLSWIECRLPRRNPRCRFGWRWARPRFAPRWPREPASSRRSLLGPRSIGWLRGRFREPIVSPSPRLRQLHQHKEATPTMGGLFVVAALIAALLIFGDLTNHYMPIVLFTLLGLAAVGAVDDLLKLAGRGGLSARWKLAGQMRRCTLVAAGLLYAMASYQPGGTELFVPLDRRVGEFGLAVHPASRRGDRCLIECRQSERRLGRPGRRMPDRRRWPHSAAAAYTSGQPGWAAYLGVPHLTGGRIGGRGRGLVGGTLGFLWFNCHPAQVFLGNTGRYRSGGCWD